MGKLFIEMQTMIIIKSKDYSLLLIFCVTHCPSGYDTVITSCLKRLFSLLPEWFLFFKSGNLSLEMWFVLYLSLMFSYFLYFRRKCHSVLTLPVAQNLSLLSFWSVFFFFCLPFFQWLDCSKMFCFSLVSLIV